MKLKVLVKQFNKMYKPQILCHFCCYTNMMVPVICGFPLRLSVIGIVYVCSICLLQNVHVHRAGMQICMHAEMHVGLRVRKYSLVTCNCNGHFLCHRRNVSSYTYETDATVNGKLTINI